MARERTLPELTGSGAITFRKKVFVPVIASSLYLLVSGSLIGFRADQLVLITLFSSMYLLAPRTRRWILGFSIFIVYWIIFDTMKAFPNYEVNTVHIGDLYSYEKALFGMGHGDEPYTPNEYFRIHQDRFFDILSGVFYLCWVPVPLAFAAYLFIRSKRIFLVFTLTFLLVNLIGFVIYYLYPAAPPWYVEQYGMKFIADTPGNVAGLGRFDTITGTSIFASLYAKSSNVFAAIPSLHAAYPLIVLYTGMKYKLGWINMVFAVIMVGIWVSAVYTDHHYVLDVLMGILVAIIGIALFTMLKRSSRFKRFLDAYERIITQGIL